jgi:hypothetical protein
MNNKKLFAILLKNVKTGLCAKLLVIKPVWPGYCNVTYFKN